MNISFFVKSKHFTYQIPEIKITHGEMNWKFQYPPLPKADSVFSDNYFSLLPDEVKKIEISDNMDAADMYAVSLYDYQK